MLLSRLLVLLFGPDVLRPLLHALSILGHGPTGHHAVQDAERKKHSNRDDLVHLRLPPALDPLPRDSRLLEYGQADDRRRRVAFSNTSYVCWR